ncbi:AAA family ATPase [Fusobacterium perfoetens]|uniref:AAA family ATPase n=1 Tax=Fusobacterium perfoetens TaxID=852 RepID=UPI0026F29920|nr:ATP-binding protein [Fusobacterium perfoetens]
MKKEKIIPMLIRAGLERDMKNFESLALTLSRIYKKENPDIADEISKILGYYNIGISSYRSIGLSSIPLDEESKFPLVSVTEPLEIVEPILETNILKQIDDFILERKRGKELLDFGINPGNSLLLYGEPGVGKTYTAKWLSYKLELPLISLDLSSTISSYLGKTGQNIKQVLEYAKSFNSILFLDEFDAIAKKRDDQSDIGELKRIVNVLLKELEDWPIGSIVIAATNHPEILDKAIWRRFNYNIKLEVLNEDLIKKLIFREFQGVKNISKDNIELIAKIMKNKSPAIVVNLCNKIKKNFILSNQLDIKQSIIEELKIEISSLNKEELKNLKKDILTKDIISKIEKENLINLFDISKSTFYRIRNKEE